VRNLPGHTWEVVMMEVEMVAAEVLSVVAML
jgi:hypothetical protein